MRMTNKIMQNNSLYNINNNKILRDKLSTMMSTQKKITRPSDDPVIAIRALRLRTSVSELTQYYEKNAPDAESWLEVTEGAFKTVTDVLTEMSKQANKGANKDLQPDELDIIIGQLKALKDEVYSTGNTDYAGRYIFTGYRTDTTLSFQEDVETQPNGYPHYTITEQLTIKDFDTINYTYKDVLDGINKENYKDAQYDAAGKEAIEQNILNNENSTLHRLRLSYDVITEDDIDLMGQTVKKANITDKPDPYKQIYDANAAGTELSLFIPETGEVLMSNAAYKKIEGGITTPDDEIRVTYQKDSWKKGDLRPEHYFACTGTTVDKDGKEKKINYNQEYLRGEGKKQVIEYDVGYNQKIQINTTADEVFGHNIDRDIDDLENALADLREIEAIRNELDGVLKGLDEEKDADYEVALKRYEAADKAYSYIRDNIHNMFGKTITKMQDHLDNTNLAVTDNGTRSQRLDLISNRLMDQRTTFETLQSENEDIDIAEVVVKLTSTELTYNSALMATGKIMQTSLMNYI